MMKGRAPEMTLLDPAIFNRPNIRKVLLVGSGGLSIGQVRRLSYTDRWAIFLRCYTVMTVPDNNVTMFWLGWRV